MLLEQAWQEISGVRLLQSVRPENYCRFHLDIDMYSKDLYQGKKVLVTGGRSGIGYAIAKDFLLHGADVFICSRKEEALAKAAEELSAYGEVHHHPCDIRKPDQIKVLAEQIKERWGRLDILINNAGGQFPAPAELISENGWASVINNNLNGTFYMSLLS